MTPEEIGARLASVLGEEMPLPVASGPPASAPATADPAPAAADPAPAAADPAPAAAGSAPAAAGPATAAGSAPAAAPHPPTAGPTPTPTPTPTSVSGGGSWARATVDVPVEAWRTALRAARDDTELAMDFFDWLSAVDELDAGFTVVAHLWSTTRRHGILIRTSTTDRATPAVQSIVDIYPGAAWHERETHEMFGIDFPDHPGEALKPLLLPPEFEGHPLRKDFVLATRVAKPWPGAKEPGESHAGGRTRQPMRPPGVPDPREWGPDAQPTRPTEAS